MQSLLRLIALSLIMLLQGVLQANAQQIHMGIGNEQISVSSSFNGDDLLIFGAIADDAPTPNNDDYDVVVVLNGPTEDTQIRKKKLILGIWVNADGRQVKAIPSSFSVSTSKDPVQIASPETMRELGLSLSGIQTNIERDYGGEFSEALLRLKTDSGLYVENVGDVEFITPKLFRARVEIPAHIPIGRHQVTGYLFKDGQLLGSKQTLMHVRKVGFEEFTYRAAHENSFLYGVVCVILAMFAGWAASVIFRR